MVKWVLLILLNNFRLAFYLLATFLYSLGGNIKRGLTLFESTISGLSYCLTALNLVVKFFLDALLDLFLHVLVGRALVQKVVWQALIV